MAISKLCAVTYSPTRTSYMVAQAVLDGVSTEAGLAPSEREMIDLTYLHQGAARSISGETLALFAVPVYAGRVAPLAMKRIKDMSGQGGPAVVVVLYGNREYEDALIELYDEVSAAGFKVVAAGAFVGEHSFSTQDMPIADHRPDGQDLETANDFGKKVFALLSDGLAADVSLAIPGNRPYKDGVGPMPFGPRHDEQRCTLCGSCEPLCPVGAISLDGGFSLDVELCTLCCSCVKSCREEALSIAPTPARAKMEWLHTNCATRKEPQLFFPE